MCSAVAYRPAGSTPDKILADAKAAMLALDPAIPLQECTWVASQKLAAHLATVPTTTGERAFEDVSFNPPGTFCGLPIISTNAVTDSGTGAKESLVLVHGASCAVADAGAEPELSTDASVQSDTQPQTGAQNLLSGFQDNLVFIRVCRYINWTMRRANAVAIVRNIVV